MAPLETIWPDEMHSHPRPVARAAMLLCGTRPLTSDVARFTRESRVELVRGLLRRGVWLGIPVSAAEAGRWD
jgi:hypothetical protein